MPGNLSSEFFDVAENLTDFPAIGRKVPEAEGRDDVREQIFRGYRIMYLLQFDQIVILTVMHGSRDLNGMENKPWQT